ncbi:hypothetical protein AMECASPLE_031501 [Ameca splendens]|uniref:Uncharacterized protein n=1 Tax=Ameca splendens TaxID=208324 RepID=A0ABV0ZFS4_9TELE
MSPFLLGNAVCFCIRNWRMVFERGVAGCHSHKPPTDQHNMYWIITNSPQPLCEGKDLGHIKEENHTASPESKVWQGVGISFPKKKTVPVKPPNTLCLCSSTWL